MKRIELQIRLFCTVFAKQINWHFSSLLLIFCFVHAIGLVEVFSLVSTFTNNHSAHYSGTVSHVSCHALFCACRRRVIKTETSKTTTKTKGGWTEVALTAEMRLASPLPWQRMQVLARCLPGACPFVSLCAASCRACEQYQCRRRRL